MDNNELAAQIEGLKLVVLALSLSVPQQKFLSHLDGLLNGREWSDQTLDVVRVLVPGHLPKKAD